MPNPNLMLLLQDFDTLSAKVDGMDLCIDFNKEKLDELKQYLFDTVIKTEKLDTWCIYAVLDGKKSGGFKLAWEKVRRRNKRI